MRFKDSAGIYAWVGHYACEQNRLILRMDTIRYGLPGGTMKKKKTPAEPTNHSSSTGRAAAALILPAVTVAGNVAANRFASILDSFLGAGKPKARRAPGTETWKADYYRKETSSLTEAKRISDEFAQKVANEGIVLLKNKGLLPLSKGTVLTPFGRGFLDPAYSGTGAAATTDKNRISPEQGLSKYFSIDKSACEAMSGANPSYPNAARNTPALDADRNSLQAVMDKGKSTRIPEYNPAIYDRLEEQVKGQVGVVVIRRDGSEGMDKRTDPYEDGTRHYLALTSAELGTIAAAKRLCGQVLVVLNTANPVELGPLMSGRYEADAILWTGNAGSRGFAALGDIVVGKVNPSGHLTDTYPTDFTQDPTFANFGEFHYSNATVSDNTLIGDLVPNGSFGTIQRPFVEYREGIYIGYRYYETAAVEDDTFVYGELDGQGGSVREGAVAYPFGYGLSYTSFDQHLTQVDMDANGRIQVSVEVTNTGDRAGKELVQIYYSAPYTEADKEAGIEKSATVLAAFSKTGILQPGESQKVDLHFHRDDMASYDYHHVNADSTVGAYILEEGDYSIQLKANAHEIIDSRDLHVDRTFVFEGETLDDGDRVAQSELDERGLPTGRPEKGSWHPVSNHFQSLNTYMDDPAVVQLSRRDWLHTHPVILPGRTRTAPQYALEEFDRYTEFDPRTDKDLGNGETSSIRCDQSPVSGRKNHLSLIDLRGLPYTDPLWDRLLDQIDWKRDKTDIRQLLFMAAYQTKDILPLGKPLTVDKDGAMGWSVKGASSWVGANVMASTWNTDLLHRVGSCMGEEALEAGINGWYAPGINIHRSPFAGRAYEYYSEDGLLSGKLAAACISGAGDKGVFSYMKHMVLNDQESFRSEGLATWANEQAIREIYLRPFQIACREAMTDIRYLDDHGRMHSKTMRAATGIMSAQNLIGGVIGFGHHGLLTDVLRGEWNFQGAVVTDLFMSKSKSERDLTLRAGSDMYMIQTPGYYALDYDSPTARGAMRKAIHHISYMIVNSNAMNGITPKSKLRVSPSPWKLALLALDSLAVIAQVKLLTGLGRGSGTRARTPR